MSLSDNIKAIREEKNLKQIEVATHIGVDKSAYSKIEKGMRSITVITSYSIHYTKLYEKQSVMGPG